jgi:polar amino acid transport system substrate-binding protein
MGPAIARDNKVILGAPEYPPFTGAQLPNQGVLTEIAVAAFKKMGYEVIVQIKPWARVLQEGKDGDIDVVLAAWYTKEREEWFVYTTSMLDDPIGFYKRKSMPISFKTYADLKPYRIGVARGYAYPAEFFAANLQTEEATDDTQLLKMLEANRVDLVITGKWTGKYIVEKDLPQFVGELEWIDPPVELQNLHACISKKAQNYEEKWKDLNEGLERMAEDGSLAAIKKKYGVE